MAELLEPIHIYDELFMENIWISFGISAEDYLKAIKIYLPKDTRPEQTTEHLKTIHGNLTCYIKPDGNLVYWIWTKDKDLSLLAHETFHLTYTLLDNKGIQLCDASEELFAYYIGMIIYKILGEEVKFK